jgi:NAD(P)-dependent dehydrogenase (short-subunit alcohol dehydrogenase family)
MTNPHPQGEGIKTIVITGSTGVLGNLVAKTFAERGHNIALLDRDQNKLDALIHDLDLSNERLYAQTIDLLNGPAVHDSAEAVHSKFGSIHALIHLVGGWTGGKTIPESHASDFESMLNQHAWTTFHLLQSFVPQIEKSNWGRVIIVSMPVTVKPSAKMALYAAAKSAQESLVLTLAEEYKDSGLTANVIHVKSIDTKNEGLRKGTTPAEIVSTMEYLFSDEARKVNGARIPLY